MNKFYAGFPIILYFFTQPIVLYYTILITTYFIVINSFVYRTIKEDLDINDFIIDVIHDKSQ